ncbi:MULTISPECIES: hypothetical protein [unclassified Mesorhizobium]|uniref:hypothetical protein n=1 Tax=unclassified Mesorhizobium TaxID=325217 RepID=UPI001FEF783D|nr:MULTISPECIES: hypothetical protein [unclassified Mesorhizobium]
MAKSKASAVNGPSEREQWEEQQFLNGFRQIKDHKSDIAGRSGEMAGIYDRLKKLGFTKADVKWAEELEEKDATDVIATMARRLRIARMFGHGVARQIEMFDADRTPAEDRAYGEGLAAGKLRKDSANPYGADSPQGQAWQRGMNDGTEFINKDLASQFEPQGDEIIKAGDEDPDFLDNEEEAA